MYATILRVCEALNEFLGNTESTPSPELQAAIGLALHVAVDTDPEDAESCRNHALLMTIATRIDDCARRNDAKAGWEAELRKCSNLLRTRLSLPASSPLYEALEGLDVDPPRRDVAEWYAHFHNLQRRFIEALDGNGKVPIATVIKSVYQGDDCTTEAIEKLKTRLNQRLSKEDIAKEIVKKGDTYELKAI